MPLYHGVREGFGSVLDPDFAENPFVAQIFWGTATAFVKLFLNFRPELDISVVDLFVAMPVPAPGYAILPRVVHLCSNA